MDCVYRNQNTGWCGQTTGPQGGCYPSGMTGYPLAMAFRGSSGKHLMLRQRV